MAKFTVIEGNGTPPGRIHDLTFERKMKSGDLAQRELLIYAYHLARENNPLKAQIVLNKISPSYFESGIYKDLYHALLGHMLHTLSFNDSEKARYHRAYEFFIVVKQSFNYFNNLRFVGKAQFKALETEFFNDSIFTNL